MPLPDELPHHLQRTVLIEAPREIVFRYFTDSQRWAAWWGPGSTIEARPGGKVYIRHPNGIETVGEVVEFESPQRIVFTYGFASGKPVPPGGSLVTIQLDEEPAGTRLQLTHEFADAATRDEHVQGWRFQLSVFANVVANELHSGARGIVDSWFEAWAQSDENKRVEILSRIAAPDIRFRDQFSLLEGVTDLSAHIGASLRFMPGIRLQPEGEIRHCQGTVLANWMVVMGDGQRRGSGTNVFLLNADRRITAVTGLWNPHTAKG
jgi:uncharacterized protein YndB with AHSA1/START domain